jgi:MSHA biogenesis protein MshL
MKMRFWAIFAVPLFVAGCVNPTANSIKNTKALPTYSAPVATQKPLPLQKDPDAYRYNDSGRSYSLTLKNSDLQDVLLLLSKESGISIVAERGLRGIVQVDAKNKKLGELLYTILKPLGYTATVENGMILVGRPKLMSRTFRVNYLKDTRNSTSNTNVSGSAAGGSGSVSVTTTGKSDFWGAIESSLEMLVFGSSGMGRRDSGGYIRGEAEKKAVIENSTTGSQQSSGKYSERSQNLGKTPKTISGDFGVKTNYDDSSRLSAQTTEVEDPMMLNTQIAENKLKQLVVNEIAGIIQITDYPENLDRVASFLADVEEGSKRQVLIQAHILEVSLSDAFSLGINWQTVLSKGATYSLSQGATDLTKAFAGSSNVFKFGAKGNDFQVFVDALKEQGNINMLSSPKISALNNQKAVIKLTTKQVSWTQTKTTVASVGIQNDITFTPQIDEVGIFLDVTPQISDNGKITMQIHPSVSDIKEFSSPNGDASYGNKPIINIREIDTMVEAMSGETIVIAGLISDKLKENKRSIPLLGDIPYLGALFTSSTQERTKAELVIMMTPYVLNVKSIEEIRREHEDRMQNLGGDFHLINNLGSMITEKNSRDWIMRSEPHRVQPLSTPESYSAPAPPKPVASPPASAAQPAPVPEKQPAPRQESKLPAEPPQIISVTPPETIQRLEQQRAEIERLENEVKAARERLIQERAENEKRSGEAALEARINRLAVGQAAGKQAVSVEESVPVAKAAIEPSANTVTASVKTTSVTSDREQTIYRSAVTAYKIGDCAESIKSFDSFLKLYPNSPFSQDAAYYRKDCADRLGQTGK